MKTAGKGCGSSTNNSLPFNSGSVPAYKTTRRIRQLLSGLNQSDTEIAWAAGFLEGEASFTINQAGQIQIRAKQVFREPLDRLQKLFGGSVGLRVKKPRKILSVSGIRLSKEQPIYYWLVNCSLAYYVLNKIYPWLSKRRRDKIDSLLAKRSEYLSR